MTPEEYIGQSKLPADLVVHLFYWGNGFKFMFETIYIPHRYHKKKITLPGKLSLDHEIGHIWAEYFINKTIFKSELNKIPSWFRMIQKFWYWNKTLRKIRIKLGFSNELWYGPDDDYRGYKRWQHELFADWWALFGKRK